MPHHWRRANADQCAGGILALSERSRLTWKEQADMAVDVIVVGAGLSGLVAALPAAARRAVGPGARSGRAAGRGHWFGAPQRRAVRTRSQQRHGHIAGDQCTAGRPRHSQSAARCQQGIVASLCPARRGRLVALPMSAGAFIATPLFSSRGEAAPPCGAVHCACAVRGRGVDRRSSFGAGWDASFSTMRSSRSCRASMPAIPSSCRCGQRSRACTLLSSATGACCGERSSVRASAGGKPRSRRLPR